MDSGMSAGCKEEFEAMSTIALLVTIVPIIFSLITFLLITTTIWKVKKIIDMCGMITSSAHWLSRTAVRVGIGASAKQTLSDYAKAKPELAKFLNLK